MWQRQEVQGMKNQEIDKLQTLFPLGHFSELGEQDQKKFISLYDAILKMRNILFAFDDFAGQEIPSPRDFQDYQSEYIDFYHEFKPKKEEKETINDDIVFEIELVKQVEVNIDYILMLVKKYQKDGNKDKKTHIFIENSFRDGVLKTTGTDIDAIMPAISRFGGITGNRTETKKRVIDRLPAYFEKYLDLVGVK